MEFLFSSQWVWTVALGVSLYFPARRLIWVLSVRRAERRHGPVDEARRDALRKRAGLTAGLLCFVFAVMYVHYLFQVRS